MKLYELSFISSIFCLIIIVAFSACSEEENNALGETKWQIVWEDEFDGTAGQALDPAKWIYEIGDGTGTAAGNGWGNQELEYYTDRPENVSLDGQGNLAITARKESFAGAAYTSGRITTKGLFDQAYGRFEARIQLPWGSGIWPAFWLVGSNVDIAPWPQCGEIDIMEYRGQEPITIHGSVHGPGYSGGAAVTKNYSLINDRFDAGFHVFAVEWGEDYIKYFVDDILYQEITQEDVPGEWVYDHPFFMILNVAVGGNFVGSPTNQTVFPQTMLVDWIRVSERVD